MPLPAALAAKLLKRGIINTTVSEPAEEVIAEEYDEVVKKATQEENQLVDKIPACPNLSNNFHTCSDYCVRRWGNKRFKADPDMLAKRDCMLDKYPLPESWLEVADPQYQRYYYWNTQTDEVSWLPPTHPRSHVTLSESRLKELNKSHTSDGESDSSSDAYEEEHPLEEERHEKTSKGKQRRQKEELDPMDPSSYSDVPRGDWKSGLDQRGSAKTGVDTTASGPLFQQRPYPSPGAILKMNKGK